MDKKTKNTILIGVVLLLVLVLGAYFYGKLSSRMGANNMQTASTPQNVQTMTDFTVYDKDGNAVNLSDYFGKPIVLNFWASWCGPCKSEMPEFNEAWEELGGEVQFLMVNVTDGNRETVDSAKAYVEEKGFTFPVFYDITLQAAMTNQAYSLPTTIFIDANGVGVAKATGAIDKATLMQGIGMIYKP